jgi:serine/threonine protein kinase
MVGLYGTNRLRPFIPNFAYIYGGVKCSPPIFGENDEVVDWCNNNKNSVNYILYENVNPSISIKKFISKCSVDEFLNIFLQILYALDFAHKKIDFTHYDLHGSNILLRIPNANEPDKLYQIPYKTENGWEYITTRYIPTFIDYGMSHFRNESLKREENIDNFGIFNFLYLSINPNRSWIMYDVYKILMWVFIYADNTNKPVADVIRYIYKFFNYKDDLKTLIEEQYECYYSIPYTENTYNLFTIDKLIKHIKSNKSLNFDFISKERNSEQLLKCEDLCIKKEDLYNKIIQIQE